jgi:alpha-D-ribose 1-methylphosphonate 5-triphosphate diphosphatase PhnM
MADYTITLTDSEDKSLRYAATSAQDWIDNAAKNRARLAKEEIIAKLVAHCNANNITIATGEDAQVTQAFDLGVVQFLADVPVPELP